MRLEAGILEPAGLGIHDIREDLVAQDLGLAERQLMHIVLIEPVDKHIESLRESAIEATCLESVVNHVYLPFRETL